MLPVAEERSDSAVGNSINANGSGLLVLPNLAPATLCMPLFSVKHRLKPVLTLLISAALEGQRTPW